MKSFLLVAVGLVVGALVSGVGVARAAGESAPPRPACVEWQIMTLCSAEQVSKPVSVNPGWEPFAYTDHGCYLVRRCMK